MAIFHLLAKFFTSIASFAYLGWLNKLGGAVFSMLKTILMLGVLISLLQKINGNGMLVKQATLDQSLLYQPVLNLAHLLFPALEDVKQEFEKVIPEPVEK